MMKEIVDRGHSIGIHTMSHVYERIYASPEAYFADLLGMQDVIYQNTGVKTTLMRFPGGSSNTVSAHSYVGLMSLLTRAVQDAGVPVFRLERGQQRCRRREKGADGFQQRNGRRQP